MPRTKKLIFSEDLSEFEYLKEIIGEYLIEMIIYRYYYERGK